MIYAEIKTNRGSKANYQPVPIKPLRFGSGYAGRVYCEGVLTLTPTKPKYRSERRYLGSLNLLVDTPLLTKKDLKEITTAVSEVLTPWDINVTALDNVVLEAFTVSKKVAPEE